MKWGVRRYQNEDGSLTPAGQKRYYKFIKKQYKKGEEHYKKFVEDNITDDDIKKLGDLNKKWMDADDEFDKDQEKADKIAYQKTFDYFNKHKKDYLNTIIKNNGGRTDDLDAFHDFRKAYEGFQDEEWGKLESSKKSEKAFNNYINESKKIANRILKSNDDVKIKNINITDKTKSIIDSYFEKKYYGKSK